MPKIIPFNRPLRPALPVVRGNVDYLAFERELKRIDELLRLSGIEDLFTKSCLEVLMAKCASTAAPEPSAAQILKTQKDATGALRCMVLKALLPACFRQLSRRIAECPLFQWFCGVDHLMVKVPSKSALQRYSAILPAEKLREIVDALTRAAAGGKDACGEPPLQLAKALELDTLWMDSTCIKANIHFPVDWVLLGDATRTLLKAIILIRRHGLKHRMPSPEAFMSRINGLSMAMTHAARMPDSKKARKRTLRSIKTLVGVVARHARRYHQLLQAHRAQTDWSEAQAARVLARIDSILTQLPAALKQAHDRIIGERKVPGEEKILSLFEADAHVIVRGKAGAKVEFGNTLFLAEQTEGLIVDYEFVRERACADSKWLLQSVERVENDLECKVLGLGGDRGFFSKANAKFLEGKGIYNALCPRNPAALKRQREDEKFAAIQRRRAQTEGRIGILKNKILDGLLRAKGYENRARGIGWAVLAHNLWVLARLKKKAAQVPLARAA